MMVSTEDLRSAYDAAQADLASLMDNPERNPGDIKAAKKAVRVAREAVEYRVRLDAHVQEVIKDWPLPPPHILRRVVLLLRGETPGPAVIRDSPEMIAVRKAEEALAKVRRDFKEAMEGCHGCGLSRKVHAYQKGYGTGYHEFADLSPDGAIKVAQLYKKKILTAERALELARA